LTRPCFLVLDQEYPGTISTRKLVIETEKLNVITAYGADEALDTFSRFPNVDGVVFDTELGRKNCEQFIDEILKVRPDIPIVTVSPGGNNPCGRERYHVSSFDPRRLLDVLQDICGKDMLLNERGNLRNG
jgi:DNA-binding NtrC family response regulator